MRPSIPGSRAMAKVLAAVAIMGAVVVTWLAMNKEAGQSLRQTAEINAARAVGEVAAHVLQQRSNKFKPVPAIAERVTENIFRVGGVAHAQLITTLEGNVVFDTGLSIQAAQQMQVLKQAAPNRTRYIILSHAHADHVGGTRFWMEDGVQVVAQERFPEEQRYLKELEPYLHGRNRSMFPWIPESPPDNAMLRYGGIEPDVLVELDEPYRFELGGIRFEVLATPGAEGADNLCLWLPQEKVLFTGDTLGPMFPQFPSIVTLRGEKIRSPYDYIQTLDKLIALEPEVLVPSHNPVVRGKDRILAGLTRIRDAVQYVHDQTVEGMNAGKSVYQLMAEIQLPPELELTQSHGKIAWGVRSLWEHYATWFHFDSTTSLYPVPVREVYGDLADLAGAGPLLIKAREHLDQGRAVHTMHLVEVVLAAHQSHREALRLRLAALQYLLQQAQQGLRVDYEMYYLQRRIETTRQQLKEDDPEDSLATPRDGES